MDANVTGAEMTAVQVDYLLLADAAQVQNGKLYLLGGGWDRLQFQEYPQSLQIAVILGVMVPWSETNRRHTFRLVGRTADADQELFKAEGEFEVGRPPGTPQAMPQIFQVALQIPLNVPRPGSYEVVGDIDDGKATKRRPFFAVSVTG